MTEKLNVQKHKRGKPYMGDDYSEFWSEVLQERDILRKKLAIAVRTLEEYKRLGFAQAIDALKNIQDVKIDKAGPKQTG